MKITCSWKGPLPLQEGLSRKVIDKTVKMDFNMWFWRYVCTSGSVVEYRLAKARVAGSNPVSCSQWEDIQWGCPLFVYVRARLGLNGSNVLASLRSSQAKLKFFLSCIRHCLQFSYDSKECIVIKKIYDIIFIEDMVKGVIPFGAGCYVCRAMRDIC